MAQDFTNKISIVVNKTLPSWQVLNTVAHISAYLGNKLAGNFGTGESFTSKDGVSHPRNTQYAIVVLAGEQADLPALAGAVRASGLPHLGFIREMIETTDDAEIEAMVASKKETEIEYLGVGVFGPKDQLKELTKKFSLWKG